MINVQSRLIRILIGLTLALILLVCFAILYLNQGSSKPTNEVWQSYIGRDTTVGILPDQYANYFTYTSALTNRNTAFKIKGAYPDTRYFSYNVYSLGDNTTQGSIIDRNIESVSGLPNPFLSASKDSIGQYYEIHVLPKKYNHLNLKNALYYDSGTRLMTIALRLYDYNIDDRGGVPLPTVEAYRIESGENDDELKPKRLPRALNLRSIVRRFSLPKMVERLSLLYETEQKVALDQNAHAAFANIPFHAINTSGFIENNDNRYLLAGITKEENEVYIFKFKSPSYTTGAENIVTSDVRYWSFNLGNAASYNFNGLKDEDAKMDSEGMVTIVLADRDADIIKNADQQLFSIMLFCQGSGLFQHDQGTIQLPGQFICSAQFVEQVHFLMGLLKTIECKMKNNNSTIQIGIP